MTAAGTPLRTVGKHVMVYGLGVVVSRAASFVMLPIYTRYLTPADYGILELLEMTTDVIAMIAGMGLAASVFRFYSGAEDDEGRHVIVSTASIAVTIIAVMVAALGFTVAPTISRVVLKVAHPDYVRLYFLTYLVQTAAIVPFAFLRAIHRSLLFVVLNVSQLLLALSLNIYLVVFHHQGVRGVLISGLLSSTVIGAVVVTYALHHTGVRFSLARAKAMAIFGFPLALWSIGSFVLTFSDRYFLNYYSTTSTVGIYSLGYKFGFVLVAFAYQPFSQVWDPHRFEVAKQADAINVFDRVFFYLNLVLGVMAFLIAIFVKDFLRVMSDRAFLPAASVVPIVLMAYILQSWTNYCNVGLYLKDQTRLAALASWIGVGVCIVLNFALIPTFAMYGAAWATVGAFAARFICVYLFSQRYYPIHYHWRRVWAVFAILAVGYGVRLLMPDWPLVATLGLTATLGGVAVGLLLGLVVTASERTSFVMLARRRLAVVFGQT